MGSTDKMMSEKIKVVLTALDMAVFLFYTFGRRAYGNLPEYMLSVVLLAGMTLAAFYDVKAHRIPNRLLKWLLAIWVALMAGVVLTDVETGLALSLNALGGGIFAGLIFLACYLLTKGQLGGGDVKLVFVMGLYLTGANILTAVLYGMIFCCFYSVVQLIRKKITMKDGVPLAPFLYLGVCVTLVLV